MNSDKFNEDEWPDAYVYGLQNQNRDLKKRIAELEEQLLVTRKYSYGDGYEGASIEFSGAIQTQKQRIALLEKVAEAAKTEYQEQCTYGQTSGETFDKLFDALDAAGYLQE